MDLDDEELEATRERNKTKREDIVYATKFAFMQQQIDKKDKRIKELEEHIKKFYDGEIYTAKQLKQIEENQNKYFINKQKIKDKIEEIKEDKDSKYYYMFLADKDIENTINILEELLEDK